MVHVDFVWVYVGALSVKLSAKGLREASLSCHHTLVVRQKEDKTDFAEPSGVICRVKAAG